MAVGELVNDATIDIETIDRGLCENRARSMLKVVFGASGVFGNAIDAATLIVWLVVLPLFALGDPEGRMHALPGRADFVRRAVSLTATPVRAAFLLTGGIAPVKRDPLLPRGPTRKLLRFTERFPGRSSPPPLWCPRSLRAPFSARRGVPAGLRRGDRHRQPAPAAGHETGRERPGGGAGRAVAAPHPLGRGGISADRPGGAGRVRRAGELVRARRAAVARRAYQAGGVGVGGGVAGAPRGARPRGRHRGPAVGGSPRRPPRPRRQPRRQRRPTDRPPLPSRRVRGAGVGRRQRGSARTCRSSPPQPRECNTARP